MFFGKDVLKICSKFLGEHLCRSANWIKLQSNFTEIALWPGCSPVNLLHIFRTSFPKSTSGGLLIEIEKSSMSRLSQEKVDEYNLNMKITYWIHRILDIIYWIHCITKYETKIRIFHYELLNEASLGLTSWSKCFFCKLYDEAPLHLFYGCIYAESYHYILQNQFRLYLSEKVVSSVLTLHLRQKFPLI